MNMQKAHNAHMTKTYSVREQRSNGVTYYIIMDSNGWSHGVGYATEQECRRVVNRMNGVAATSTCTHGSMACPECDGVYDG